MAAVVFSAVLSPACDDPNDPLDALLGSLGRDGKDFERLCLWFLRTDPEYAAEFEEVWLWDDWPGRWARDKGIDLVAVTKTGRTVAVQAKNYGEGHSITKRDLDTFLSESSRPVIDERLLIASTQDIAATAREVVAGQEKPVHWCLLDRLRSSAVSWPGTMAELTTAAPAAHIERAHQRVALDAIAAWASTDETRGQVIMACGTGKTLVSVRAADELGAQLVLVLAPTLNLLRQTARDWTAQARTHRMVMRVCSDASDPDSEEVTVAADMGARVTTDPAEIAAFIAGDGPRIVFSTYASSPRVAEAMATETAAHVTFDLAVADEAHRCAGLASSPQKTILDGERIRAARRLFFTATPTVFDTDDQRRAHDFNVPVASMDDASKFGERIHHLSFAEAVEQDLLCPYEIAVIPVRDSDVRRIIDERQLVTVDGEQIMDAGTLATQIACARAMSKFEVRRLVAFQPSIRDSKRFAQHFPTAAALLPDDQQPPGKIWSEHIDGSGMAPSTRHRIERGFRQDGEDHRLLCNVRVLVEGIDVPGIDGIAFVDTQRGSVSIIQAVGRAMRKAPGKTAGIIVLPIVIRDGERPDQALQRPEHRTIVRILGALRSHDPDIFRSLDDIRFTGEHTGQRAVVPRRFVIDAPLDVGPEFADAIDLAVTKALSTRSERTPVRRVAPLEPVVLKHPEMSAEEANEERVFLEGLVGLHTYSRYALAPSIPGVGSGFPVGAWWAEFDRRWAAGEVEEDTMQVVADRVSWLAPDLGPPDSPLREAMRARTRHSVASQLACQISVGGIHQTGPFSCLLGYPRREYFDSDNLAANLAVIEASFTHAGFSQRMRLIALMAATRPLLAAIDDATEPDHNMWGGTRNAIIYGYTERVARTPDGKRHHTARTEPEPYLLGRQAAEALTPWVEKMSLYRSDQDETHVSDRRLAEESLPPHERLDALGWDIFLLALHRDASHQTAVDLGKTGTMAQRKRVRTDLLLRQPVPWD